ncbi:MAG TPA: ferrochelatase, partial [Candidatus Limnocylindria bacterium]|nr:ferrochelatase [Candidatus Limnocylindria bacterium]
MSTGVVLMTYGAPHGEADLPRYLAAVRGGRAADPALVAEMARRYAVIGGSPLVERTVAQAVSLERELGGGYRCVAGMRFSPPTVADAVGSLAAAGATRVVGICMSPQWSPLLMGGYERELRAAADAAGCGAAIAGAWHREPLFIASLAERTRDALRGLDDPFVLLTAHSLPKRVFDAEPGYIRQLRETGDLVAAAAGLHGDRWRWAYQSAGHTQEEWLRPDLVELFPDIVATGTREILVVPVQ